MEEIDAAADKISFAISALSKNQAQRINNGERLIWCIPLSWDRNKYLQAELYILETEDE